MFPSFSNLRVFLLFVLITQPLEAAPSEQDVLLVNTSSGRLTGIINGIAPDVRQFLGVPIAQALIGNLRWEPPAALPANASNRDVDATKFSVNCSQYESATPTVYSTFYLGSANTNLKNMPVLIFLYGGGLSTGGSSVPFQDPAKWVQRTQSHIVVSVRYCLNVFGFPNAPGLESQNLGYLDMRAGVEWVYANIVYFGSDPEKMVLWGQSAGATGTDIYNYAYPDDPIFKGFICDSGTALGGGGSASNGHTSFIKLSAHFNCSGDSILPCMRNIPQNSIEGYLKASTDPSLSFGAIIDNTTVFSNYTQRLLSGGLSTNPTIFGFNDVDEISLDAFPSDPLVEGANVTLADQIFTSHCVCTESESSLFRSRQGIKTYRYQYRGNFTNVSPLPWLGAYHSSELPIIFGTSGDFRGKSTPFEIATSEAMQDRWLAFAKDPENGLEQFGWGNSSEQFAEVFDGFDENGREVAAQYISLAYLVETCVYK